MKDVHEFLFDWISISLSWFLSLSENYIKLTKAMLLSVDSGGDFWFQVTNTPWGERVTFVFNPEYDVVAKPLHVSPFMVCYGAIVH